MSKIKSYKDQVIEAEWVGGDAVWLTFAQALADEADDEVNELRQEVDSLQEQVYELQREPWPEWTTEILKMVREKSGYDGYDDQDEGVDIVEEVRECISEMTQQIDKADATVARLEAEVERLNGEPVKSGLLDLVSRIRFAVGDNGKRMQPELVEYLKALKKDAERYQLWRREYTSADEDRSDTLISMANAWTPEAVDAVLDAALAARSQEGA